MIKSKIDLAYYQNEDMKSAGINVIDYLLFLKHPTLYFTRLMRQVEYHRNVPQGPIAHLYGIFLKVYFRIVSIYLGFSISPNTCGPGLVINHWGTIVISPSAKVGRNARINVCVNIGIKDGLAPTIGDDCYIGPGAKLFGGITLGNNVKIGANAVVNKSFPDNVTLAGVPAKVIRSTDAAFYNRV
jgi:serine O-acetyltransferase